MDHKRSLSSLVLSPVLGLSLAAGARAQQTVAVLSAKSGAYLEAFSAFTAAYGAEVPSYDLSAERPRFGPDTRVVVAFGGKAAAFQYPERTHIVYCLAPGYLREPPPGGRAVKISLMPDLDALIAKIRKLQPGIRSLGVFWISPRYSAIEGDIKAAGARGGVTVRTFKLQDLDALPSLLRGEISRLNAFWVPPDPLLMRQDTLQALRNFSWDNGIAFYGTSRSHTKEGAVASLGPGFAEMGRATAAAADELLGGGAPPAVLFLKNSELSVNFEGARKCGVPLPPGIVKDAAYAYP